MRGFLERLFQRRDTQLALQDVSREVQELIRLRRSNGGERDGGKALGSPRSGTGCGL